MILIASARKTARGEVGLVVAVILIPLRAKSAAACARFTPAYTMLPGAGYRRESGERLKDYRRLGFCVSAVVNVQTLLTARVLPARSSTPVVILAVYRAFGARSAVGSKVAMKLASS